MNYRKLPDGKLMAPRRGRPPAVPDGYERDPGDSYVFLPKLQECDYRITEVKANGCCEKIVRFCEYHEREVSRKECVDCTIQST